MTLKLRGVEQRPNQGNRQENMLQKVHRFSSNLTFLITLWVSHKFCIFNFFFFFWRRDITPLNKRTLKFTKILPEHVYSRILAKSWLKTTTDTAFQIAQFPSSHCSSEVAFPSTHKQPLGKDWLSYVSRSLRKSVL